MDIANIQHWGDFRTLKYGQINTLNKEIASIEYQMRMIKDKELEEKDVIALRKYRDELVKNDGVSFTPLKLHKLFHVTASYDIGLYCYKLNIKGLDNPKSRYDDKFPTENIVIDEIPKPTTELERKLYPQIKKFLEPHMPIKFRLDGMYLDDYVLVTENKDLCIDYDSISKDYYIFVHYLM